MKTGATASLILFEKNNSNLYQAKANKEWNHYLASDIVDQVLRRPKNQEMLQEFQYQAEQWEQQAEDSTTKANEYLKKDGHLITAGIFFETAIALSAMAVLVKKRAVWVFSLGLAGVGVCFFLLGFI